MPNPWLKKNPFMSLWLSAANRLTGSLRARACAAGKRQQNAAVTEVTRESLKILADAAKPAAARTRRRR
jgi:hypothetical protein